MANGHDNSNNRIVRLFVGTAVVATVFSIGLIVGQHLLTDRARAPVVSVNQAAAETEPEQPAPSESGGESPDPDMFSFYDALTSPEVRDLDETGTDELAARRLGDDAEVRSGLDDGAPTRSAESRAGTGDEAAEEAIRYTLQVGTHSTLEEARAQMDRLRILELSPRLVVEEGTEQTRHYLVELGDFPSEQRARAQLESLENQYELRGYVAPL